MEETARYDELPQRGGWAPAAMWAALVALLAAGFAHNFTEMWIRWFPRWRRVHLGLYERITGGESYYTHAPLVPPLALLIAVLLVRHTRIRLRPRPVAGAVVLVGSLLLHLMSCLARVNFASGFAMMGVLAGLVLLLWGGEALRRLWFPIALVAFMVPLPQVSIYNLNFRLKIFAAEVGVHLAGLLGIAIERVGNKVLLAGDKTLVIANVCNGLRTIISLLAFGALYAYVCRLRGLWRLGLFLFSLPVAIVSNSVRILGLILVAEIWDEQVATGWFHDWSGILIFVLAFVLMFGAERFVLWLRKRIGRPAEVVPLFHDVRRGPGDAYQGTPLYRAVAGPRGVVALVLLGVSAGGAWWLNRTVPQRFNQQVARAALPRELDVGGRRLMSYDLAIDEQTIDILETGDYLNRMYVAPGQPPLNFTIIFSKDNRKGTHPPDVCLAGSGEGIVAKGRAVLEGLPGHDAIPLREIILQTGPRRQYFAYVYKCGRKYTPSFWEQQFAIFLNGLLNRDASGALIRVSTEITGTVDEARRRALALLRAAVPHLDEKLN